MAIANANNNNNNNNAQQQIVVALPPSTSLRYPSKSFDCFDYWMRHFEAMSPANNWNDARQWAILLSCLKTLHSMSTKISQTSTLTKYKVNQH